MHVREKQLDTRAARQKHKRTTDGRTRWLHGWTFACRISNWKRSYYVKSNHVLRRWATKTNKNIPLFTWRYLTKVEDYSLDVSWPFSKTLSCDLVVNHRTWCVLNVHVDLYSDVPNWIIHNVLEQSYLKAFCHTTTVPISILKQANLTWVFQKHVQLAICIQFNFYDIQHKPRKLIPDSQWNLLNTLVIV